MSLVNKHQIDNIWPEDVNEQIQNCTEYSTCLENEHSETFTHTWTIENISQYFTTDYHGPETIFSENFPKYTAQSEYTNQLSVKFYLELVPNGEDEECKDFVSVFLYMPCCAKPNVILKYKFWIINILREKCNFEENCRKFSRGEGWGWREFILKKDLLDLTNGFIANEDDKLTLYCEITVIHEDIVKLKRKSLSKEVKRNSIIPEVPRSKSIGKLEFGGLSFDGSIFDAIDGKPIVIEDGKVDEMKSLWEYRKGKY